MGGTTWSGDAYARLKTDYSTKTMDQIFTSKSTDADMSPKGVKFRESRDSDAHPNSIAIMIGLDETGSMGSIPERLVREKLGTLMETLIAHDVPDAHVLFAGIGDHLSDNSPLQVGQFEAGTDELNKCLAKIYLEGGGGGQTKESYSLAWLFAGRHTSIDCFEKRNTKGFLFTIGDEGFHELMDRNRLADLMGYDFPEDVTSLQLLSEAQRMYHVFHLHCNETSTGKTAEVKEQWKKTLGERMIMVEDYNNIAEIIATTVAVVMGADLKKVVAGFDSKIANSVSTALMHITTDLSKNTQEGAITL